MIEENDVTGNSSTTLCSTLPRAMVLVYQPELSCSVWQDFECRARSIAGIERQLKQGIRCGDWVAWRLMRIEKEVMGNVD